MRRVTKLFNTKATSVNETDYTVSFVISDNQPDRYNEIVDQKSWNFREYLKNPLVLWGHDPSEPENVLGTASSLQIAKDGSNTTALLKFDTEINPKAALVFNQIKAGSLRTVSVGFVNHTEEKGDTPVLKDNDLLEISVVPIPANPRAIALALKEGTLNSKDAKWLMDGMRKEADELETQLKSINDNQSKDDPMNEQVTKQLSTLTEAVTKLAETQAHINEHIKDFVTKGAVADIAAVEDQWDLQDAKWDHLAPISTLYYALTEAYLYSGTPVDQFATLVAEFLDLAGKVADGTYEKDAPTDAALAKAFDAVSQKDIRDLVAKSLPLATADAADTESADEEVKEIEHVEEPAKGGSNDQPGAGEADELDDDAELTPELQEKIDAELETVAV